jgi:Asp-tRNA(Asn)/Glu-tRNA(Gln) amidotransferase C subunit
MNSDDDLKDLLAKLNRAQTGRKVAGEILEGIHDAPEDLGKPRKADGPPGPPKKAAFEARVANAQKALNATDPGDVATTVATLARQKREEGRVEGMAWGMNELLKLLEKQDIADLANGTLPPTHAWHSSQETRPPEPEKPKPGKWQKGLEGLEALKQQLDERQETDATPPAPETPPEEPKPSKAFLPILWKPKALVRWQRPAKSKPPLPEVIHLGQTKPAVAPWEHRVAKAWADKPTLQPKAETAERLAEWRAQRIDDNTTGGYCQSQDRRSDCIMRATERIIPISEVKRIQQKGRERPATD